MSSRLHIILSIGLNISVIWIQLNQIKGENPMKLETEPFDWMNKETCKH